MDIKKMPNSSVKDPESIMGKSLKRSISANIPVVENMIEMSRVVKRGSRVVLVIDHGGLSIKAAGKIKEKGYVGMAVRAVNLSSRREVVGVLIDENTVKVEL
jgi:flagella basal body P-ring formation protein FlgA